MPELDVDWIQEHESAPLRTPEQELFLAVLLQAFNDIRDVAYTSPADCAEARLWLLYDTYDFVAVCVLAGVDDKKIRSMAVRYVEHLANGGSTKAIPLKGNE